MNLNFFENGSRIAPLVYSTGKTQVDVIDEILEAFEPTRPVWMRGSVGTGKSVVALRAALKLGGGAVSVPTKVLSDQYYRDYCAGSKYFVKEDGKRAVISVLKGRRNFACPYLKAMHPSWPRWKLSCQNRGLPCTAPVGRGGNRWSVLEACRWAGTVQQKGRISGRSALFGEYRGIGGSSWGVFLKGGNSGCPYWRQYRGFVNADVCCMNSAKFKIETLMGRLPAKPLVVVDEADSFLDGISPKVVVSSRRIEQLKRQIRQRADDQTFQLEKSIDDVWRAFLNEEIDPFDMVRQLHGALENTDMDISWELAHVLHFSNLAVYEDGRDHEDNPGITFFVPDPKPVVADFIDRLGTRILMMSATAMPPQVLKDIFGIDPVFVEGEPKFPGTLVQRRTGDEVSVNYSSWQAPEFRARYAGCRDDILSRTVTPCFAPVHAIKYLPACIDSHELLRRSEMTEGGVTFSTKMDRGADLKRARSVVILKYPYPDVNDPLLRAMKRRLGDAVFWSYYKDLARREFVQQIGRTTRSPEDVVEFWSPDLTCHAKLTREWKGDIQLAGDIRR